MPARHVWTHSLSAALLLMAPFDLLAALAMDVYLPVVPHMPEFLATTPTTVQLTLSLYLLMLGCGQLIFGPLSDRVGRRPVLLGGALLFTVASAALACTSSATPFVALRIAQAAGGAAAVVATFATVRDVYAGRREGTVIYGLFGAMLAFVPAFGPVLGAVVNHGLGWRGIFLLLALLCSLAGMQAWSRWPETWMPIPGSRPMRRLGDILTSAPFWIYTLARSAAMGAFFVYFSVAPRVLVNRIGLSPVSFSLVFATVAVVMIVTSRFSFLLVARWGERGCLTRAMALLLAGAMLLSLSQVLLFPSVWGFVAPMWVIAIGISTACAVAANGALRPFGGVAGTATALHSGVESLMVSCAGTVAVVWLPADTAWPLIAFATVSALVTMGLARWALPDANAELIGVRLPGRIASATALPVVSTNQGIRIADEVADSPLSRES
jgi:MFS transporter, DHA1 family, chloramphenicol/florfenicol resistance protein